jgi:hypothetical protein
MTTNQIDDQLMEIYSNVSNPASFGGINKLYIQAQKLFPTLTRKYVQNWLKRINSYTLHKPVRHKVKRNKILIQRINEQWEADLVDMQMFSKTNNGFKYILTVIDSFSKKLYVFALKNKNQFSIIKAFKKLFKNVKPEKLRTDRGLEFNNNVFKSFLKKNDVIYFTSNDSKIKCAIVERVNRTLKEKMFRYFTHNGTRKYIDILDDLVSSYNNSYHRSIKMSPSEVDESNEKIVLKNLYGTTSFKDIILPNLTQLNSMKLNDNLRIKYDLNKNFDKSYYPLWTDRTYNIRSIIDRPIKTFQLQSADDEIDGSFYGQELQKVADEDSLNYRIEKVIEKRKRNRNIEYLVKWIGYPVKYNQWIPEKMLKRLSLEKDGSMNARRPHLKK